MLLQSAAGSAGSRWQLWRGSSRVRALQWHPSEHCSAAQRAGRVGCWGHLPPVLDLPWGLWDQNPWKALPPGAPLSTKQWHQGLNTLHRLFHDADSLLPGISSPDFAPQGMERTVLAVHVRMVQASPTALHFWLLSPALVASAPSHLPISAQ